MKLCLILIASGVVLFDLCNCSYWGDHLALGSERLQRIAPPPPPSRGDTSNSKLLRSHRHINAHNNFHRPRPRMHRPMPPMGPPPRRRSRHPPRRPPPPYRNNMKDQGSMILQQMSSSNHFPHLAHMQSPRPPHPPQRRPEMFGERPFFQQDEIIHESTKQSPVTVSANAHPNPKLVSPPPPGVHPPQPHGYLSSSYKGWKPIVKPFEEPHLRQSKLTEKEGYSRKPMFPFGLTTSHDSANQATNSIPNNLNLNTLFRENTEHMKSGIPKELTPHQFQSNKLQSPAMRQDNREQSPFPSSNFHQTPWSNNPFNLAASMSEEVPVKKPFPKFQPKPKPSSGDSPPSESPENGQSPPKFPKLKFNRPKPRPPGLNKPPTSASESESDIPNNNKPVAGPPIPTYTQQQSEEVQSQSSPNQPPLNLKAKLSSRGRVRVRSKIVKPFNGQSSSSSVEEGLPPAKPLQPFEPQTQSQRNRNHFNNQESSRSPQAPPQGPPNRHPNNNPHFHDGPPNQHNQPEDHPTNDFPPPPPPPGGRPGMRNNTRSPPPPHPFQGNRDFEHSRSPNPNFHGRPPHAPPQHHHEIRQSSGSDEEPNTIFKEAGGPPLGGRGGGIGQRRRRPQHQQPQQQTHSKPSEIPIEQSEEPSPNDISGGNVRGGQQEAFNDFFYPPGFSADPAKNPGAHPVSFMTMPGSQPQVIHHPYETIPQGGQPQLGQQQQQQQLFQMNVIRPQQPSEPQYQRGSSSPVHNYVRNEHHTPPRLFGHHQQNINGGGGGPPGYDERRQEEGHFHQQSDHQQQHHFRNQQQQQQQQHAPTAAAFPSNHESTYSTSPQTYPSFHHPQYQQHSPSGPPQAPHMFNNIPSHSSPEVQHHPPQNMRNPHHHGHPYGHHHHQHHPHSRNGPPFFQQGPNNNNNKPPHSYLVPYAMSSSVNSYEVRDSSEMNPYLASSTPFMSPSGPTGPTSPSLPPTSPGGDFISTTPNIRRPAGGPSAPGSPEFAAPASFGSGEYDKIPMQFAEQLRPILRDEVAVPSQAQQVLNERHVHQSPEIHPPATFFDDFFKPFDESYNANPEQELDSKSSRIVSNQIQAPSHLQQKTVSSSSSSTSQRGMDKYKGAQSNQHVQVVPHPHTETYPHRPREEASQSNKQPHFVAPSNIHNEVPEPSYTGPPSTTDHEELYPQQTWSKLKKDEVGGSSSTEVIPQQQQSTTPHRKINKHTHIIRQHSRTKLRGQGNQDNNLEEQATTYRSSFSHGHHHDHDEAAVDVAPVENNNLIPQEEDHETSPSTIHEEDLVDSNTPQSINTQVHHDEQLPKSTQPESTDESAFSKSRRPVRRRRPDTTIRRRYFSSRVKSTTDLTANNNNNNSSTVKPGELNGEHGDEETPFESQRGPVLRRRKLFNQRRNNNLGGGSSSGPSGGGGGRLRAPERKVTSVGGGLGSPTTQRSSDSESVTYGESQWFRIKPTDSMESSTFHSRSNGGEGGPTAGSDHHNAFKATTENELIKSKHSSSRVSEIELLPLESTTEVLSGEEPHNNNNNAKPVYSSKHTISFKESRKLSSK